MIAEFLEEIIKDEEVCLFDREDDGERFSLGDCVNAIPSDDILRVIKQLKTVTFGDIKNKVGVRFRVECNNPILQVITLQNNERLALNTENCVVVPIGDYDLVEVINETETN